MFFDPYCTGSILKSVRQASQVNLAEMSAMGQKQTLELPPKADIRCRDRHVRFVPKSRHMQCSKKPCYSITSSARESTVPGMVRPSALAVFKFTVSSYLVAACTGSSAGFSPLSMRST